MKAAGARDVATFNVLEDDEVRQGIKDYAQWPTIPQLYVGGEFVGGSGLMMEMYESGELHAVRLLERARALGLHTHLASRASAPPGPHR